MSECNRGWQEYTYWGKSMVIWQFEIGSHIYLWGIVRIQWTDMWPSLGLVAPQLCCSSSREKAVEPQLLTENSFNRAVGGASVEPSSSFVLLPAFFFQLSAFFQCCILDIVITPKHKKFPRIRERKPNCTELVQTGDTSEMFPSIKPRQLTTLTLKFPCIHRSIWVFVCLVRTTQVIYKAKHEYNWCD